MGLPRPVHRMACKVLNLFGAGVYSFALSTKSRGMREHGGNSADAGYKDVMDLKPIMLLALALFLASAPQPDSRTVAEMTRDFIVPPDEFALLAAETPEPLAEAPGDATAPVLIDAAFVTPAPNEGPHHIF